MTAMLSLMTLTLRSKRDILLARQRARQIAALFQFEAKEKACIAAGSFAIATQALQQSRSSQLCIQTESDTLHIFTKSRGNGVAEKSMRLVKRLPRTAAEFAAEDIQWLCKQLNHQSTLHVFEEIHHQNREMLAVLHALHVAQAEVERLQGRQPITIAA
jgi:hypothetical protein